MEDALAAGEGARERGAVEELAVDELAADALEAAAIAGVDERAHRVAAGDERAHQVGADVAGGAGDRDLHRRDCTRRDVGVLPGNAFSPK